MEQSRWSIEMGDRKIESPIPIKIDLRQGTPDIINIEISSRTRFSQPFKLASIAAKNLWRHLPRGQKVDVTIDGDEIQPAVIVQVG